MPINQRAAGGRAQIVPVSAVDRFNDFYEREEIANRSADLDNWSHLTNSVDQSIATR